VCLPDHHPTRTSITISTFDHLAIKSPKSYSGSNEYDFETDTDNCKGDSSAGMDNLVSNSHTFPGGEESKGGLHCQPNSASTQVLTNDSLVNMNDSEKDIRVPVHEPAVVTSRPFSNLY